MNEELQGSFQRVQDVVSFLRRLHATVGEACDHAGSTLGESRTGLSARALAERQLGIARFLSTGLADTDQKIMETWIQFLPSEPIEARLERMRSKSIPAEQLAGDVLQFQNDVAEFLEVVRSGTSSIEVDEFLGSVAEREFMEAKHAAKIVREEDDL